MADESALKDGNRNSTMLFEKDGEVRRVSNTNPLPVTGLQTASPDTTLSESKEQTGNGTPTIVTPSAGKRLAVKGMCISLEAGSGIEAGIRFAGGKVLHKVYRSDESGALIPSNFVGAVNEALVIFTVSFGAGQRAFFVVNYQEL
jgi:hypothetical protein